MLSLSAGLALHIPSEVAFSGVVVSNPHFFYGRNSHAVHEAFDVRSDDGHRVEIVDNVNIAPRIPAVVGERIGICGELVPHTSRGPLVHWTHHDPTHAHADGYIDLAGHRYA